ncbi:MAG TPA: putative toxin-antitoxin system toxin component, PIN family [Blastocatellia bacterium]|nr:putative toxin-antitoxin system toxin component, PIN family [Blastocatellia bacterium]
MPRKTSVRVILDTNWYISAAINRGSRRTLYALLTDPSIEIVFSTELLKEFQDVISRKRFRKIISETQAMRFQSLVLSKLKEVKIKSTVELSRDAKDNYLFALAMDAEADYLVTGDDDLLVLERIGKTKIVRMAEFVEAL